MTIKPHLSLFFVGLMLLFAANTWADNIKPKHRPQYERDLRQLAYQLHVDAGVLDEAAYDQRRDFGRRGSWIIERIDAFHESADRFYEVVNRYRKNPTYTMSAYRQLEGDYDRAETAIGYLHDDGAVRRAARNVADTMNALERHYDDDRGGRREHVAETAYEIQRLADYAHARARAEMGRSRYNEKEMDRAIEHLDELRDAARDFYQEAAERGDRDDLREAYRDLVRKYYRAERRVWYFSLTVRNSVTRIGDNLDRLEFISPDYQQEARRNSVKNK